MSCKLIATLGESISDLGLNPVLLGGLNSLLSSRSQHLPFVFRDGTEKTYVNKYSVSSPMSLSFDEGAGYPAVVERSCK